MIDYNFKTLEENLEISTKELIFCDKKDCKERGEYTKCYFDGCYNCIHYLKYKGSEN